MLGWHQEALVEVELPSIPMELVGDAWPRGGVGPCPRLSEGGEDAGYFTTWKQDGKISSEEMKILI